MKVDIVGLFEQLITNWKNVDKCGYCWEFEAPLRLSDLNESEKKSEDCCVRVFLTNLEVDYDRTYENGLTADKSTRYSFDLHFLMYDDIGTNVYGEQGGYPIDESKWKRILLPLKMCLNSSFDFCEILGRNLDIEREHWRTEIDYMDNNYTGWMVSVTLKDNEYDC